MTDIEFLTSRGFEDKPEYTIQEISDITGDSIRTLQNYCATNRLPAAKRGRSYVILQPDLVEYLRNGVSHRIPPLKKKLIRELEQAAYNHNLNVNDLVSDLIQEIKAGK